MLQILLKIIKHQDAEVKGERVTSGGHIHQKEDDDDNDDLCPHLVVVNVSPIDYGHVLLVPHPQKCLPQVGQNFKIIMYVGEYGALEMLCLLSVSLWYVT